MIKKKIKVTKNRKWFRFLINITKEDIKRLNLTDKLKDIDMSNYKTHEEDLDVILLSIKEYNKLNNVFIGYESNNIFQIFNNRIDKLEEELEISKKENKEKLKKLQLFNIIIDNLEEELEISKNKNKKLEIKINNKELTREEILSLINNYNLSSKINN
jgi:hypothetical protein